jgi:uncharacterized membrane protein
MGTVLKLVLGWLLFGGTHLLGSSLKVRGFLVRRLGLPAFKGIYSLVALATLVPLSLAYFLDKHAGAALFAPTAAMRTATQVLMFLAVMVLGQALATSHPMTTLAELKGSHADRPRGIQRVTRHPMNFAFALFGAAHCLSNPSEGDWIFFGGFVVYAVASAVHQDRRTFATGPEEIRRFQARTSLLPFGAILSGRQSLAPGEYSPVALAVSVAAFVALRWAHPFLFGGFKG